MNLVYAVDRGSYNKEDHIGVIKKVESQIEQFQSNGINVSLCQYSWKGGYPQIEINGDTDFLYFRRIEPSIKLILKLMEIKKINKGIKMVMEIPTFPFKHEVIEKISLKRRINQAVGTFMLGIYVNRIVLCGQEKKRKKLYGVPVIHINNGVDYNKITVSQGMQEKNPDCIQLLCVSGCYFWHGYDRVIEGLHNYYEDTKQKRKVFFHIVGEGDCLKEYERLAEKYGMLNKEVFIYGKKTGEELDKIYSKCDIAIDHLGAHRKKIYYLSTLKSKEYVAKGLPILSSVMLDIYNSRNKEYIKLVQANETPVNIEEVMEFYDQIYTDKKKIDVSTKIREVFYEYCDWKFMFHPVINYFMN